MSNHWVPKGGGGGRRGSRDLFPREIFWNWRSWFPWFCAQILIILVTVTIGWFLQILQHFKACQLSLFSFRNFFLVFQGFFKWMFTLSWMDKCRENNVIFFSELFERGRFFFSRSSGWNKQQVNGFLKRCLKRYPREQNSYFLCFLTCHKIISLLIFTPEFRAAVCLQTWKLKLWLSWLLQPVVFFVCKYLPSTSPVFFFVSTPGTPKYFINDAWCSIVLLWNLCVH